MPDSSLKLSSTFSLPLDAITETFGILATRGAGKSNTAAVMAEEMFANNLPFVVIDPVGAWWGLRSSKTGRGPGLDIPLFGGRRGDVPLERTGGRLIADLVVDERLSCILDLTEFDSEAAKKQFLLDFAKRLYRRNEEPLHLFLEEADDYIPQRPMRDEAQLLRAWENIVRRGRARGLGMTMITQRSASINKNVLTQVQTLIAMRTTGPQDRKAIEEWVKYNDQSKDILKSLPSLKTGEAWVWSPQFLKITKRVKFRRRHTFDSGSTPKMARKSKTARLADVNVDKLKIQMADTIKRAEDIDPKFLKKRIRELEKELSRGVKNTPNLAFNNENRVLRDDNKMLRKYIDDLRIKHNNAHEALREHIHKLTELLAKRELLIPPLPIKLSSAPKPTSSFPQMNKTIRQPVQFVGVQPNIAPPQIDNLGKAQVAFLRAFWWLRHETATKNNLAFFAGYSAKSSHVNNVISSLRTAGLVSGLRITEAGEKLMEPIAEEKPTGLELREWLRPKLGKAHNAFLDVLIQANGELVDTETMCNRAGYSPTSSHFNNVMSRLRSIGAAEGYARDGGMKAAAVFFE